MTSIQAWLNEKGTKPVDKCESCGYKLSFLMQLYSNMDHEDPNYHRMLYVFACVSPTCISTQRAIRVYRGYAKDDPTYFASDAVYNKVKQAKSDQELIKQGLMPKPEEEKKEAENDDDEDDVIDVNIKEVGLEFEEWAIETDIERAEVTKFYIKESFKLKQGKKQQ